jgi:hypothetical protein
MGRLALLLGNACLNTAPWLASLLGGGLEEAGICGRLSVQLTFDMELLVRAAQYYTTRSYMSPDLVNPT